MNYIHDMSKSLPDIRDLEVLKYLLQDPHTTRCAVKLNLTQSAISHTLRRIRDYFSDPLFVRTKKGLEPTSFLLSLDPLLQQLMQAAESVRHHGIGFDPAASRRAFNIAIPETISIPFIPELLKIIRREAPHIRLNFISVHPQDARTLFNDDRADLYVGSFKNAEENLKTQLLYKEKFLCLTRRESKIIQNGKIKKEAYTKARHMKLSLQGSRPSYVDQALARQNVVRDDYITLPFYLLGFEAMQNEDILVTAPESMTNYVLRDIFDKKRFKTAPFPYDIEPLHIHQYWPAKLDKDAGHAWLRQKVKETGKLIAAA